jgi:hypothetical protein
MKFVKRPIVVEAIQIPEVTDINGHAAFDDWAAQQKLVAKYYHKRGSLFIKTLEGEMKASAGDFIIKGLAGEFYPCKPDIFEKTYDVYEDIK